MVVGFLVLNMVVGIVVNSYQLCQEKQEKTEGKVKRKNSKNFVVDETKSRDGQWMILVDSTDIVCRSNHLFILQSHLLVYPSIYSSMHFPISPPVCSFVFLSLYFCLPSACSSV